MIPVIFITAFLLFIAYAVLMLYYAAGWSKTHTYFPDQQLPQTTVSIIIAARNEASNIVELLQALQQQDYPKSLLEIIIVDDHSEDKTAALVRAHGDASVKLICMSDVMKKTDSKAFKKMAIATGVTQSSGSLIITTDADCLPGPSWVSTIMSYYEKHHPSMIVMPVNMTGQNTLVGIFQHLDFMCMQGITAASIQQRFTMMCNGANLAYTKKAFEAVDGFHGIDTLASGDDMMLMHKIAKLDSNKIMYLKSKEVIINTPAEKTWRQFLQQRMRWASKSTAYQDSSLMPILALVFAFNLMLIASFISCFLSDDLLTLPWFEVSAWYALGFIVGMKILIEILFLIPVSRFFGSTKKLFFFSFLQPLHILYIVVAALLGQSGSYSWKGRHSP